MGGGQAEAEGGSASTGIGTSTGRCHEEYSLETLLNRAFAFDGDAAAISEPIDDGFQRSPNRTERPSPT
jgi:hypothetical protein